ncbi:hypothetical protein RND81_12G067900 [Saponaria officinalis]|uniref:Transferase n=1 Tax=Saponaria officinalis TaxID=3572 RepID=A0AAW1H7G3_SAPOF
MEDKVQVQVTIISNELVKPSSPTPPHLKTHTLSYVDQMVPLPPLFPTCGIAFYTPTTTPLNIPHLKSTLSETLTRFYPVAGRVTQSTIMCDDRGVPFIETRVDSNISSVLDSPGKLDVMFKFLPPRESLKIADFGFAHLSIQVNVFACGGVAIGWYDIHKVMDGLSSASFFKHWASLAQAQPRPETMAQPKPDFESGLAVFPPVSEYKPLMSFDGLKGVQLGPPPAVKRFVFRNGCVSRLKEMAGSEKVGKPSRFMAVAGFIWEQAFRASQEAVKLMQGDEAEDTVLQVTLDMRSRLNPPLSKSTMGNLATIAIVRAEKRAKLPDFVAEIDNSISNLNNKIKEYKGDKGVEGIRENWNNLMEISSIYKEKSYKLVSWCRLGFNELDFRFGKPELVVPTDGIISPLQRNVIILNDYSSDVDGDGDGIEAWLFLEEKEMEILECNQEFLDFASPLLL